MIIHWNKKINDLCGDYYDRLVNNLKKKIFLKSEIRELIEEFLKECDQNQHGGSMGFMSCLRKYVERHEIKNISQLFAGELRKFAVFLLGEEWAGYLDSYMHIVAESPYTQGYGRRSMRTRLIDLHLNDNLFREIKSFVMLKASGLSTAHLLQGGRDQEEIAALGSSLDIEPWLSVKLELGDEECVAYLIEAMTSENNHNRMTFSHFRAIAKSGNPQLLEAEGKLLLAARLQEGLRQAIVETMDEGKPESLIYMLGVIRDNNLQRFASVKRAMAVITGLTEPDAPERISGKFLELMYAYITDRSLARTAVESRDAMEVYLGLWGLAFYEVEDIAAPVRSLINDGPAYRLEAAMLLIQCVEYPLLSANLSREAIMKRPDDHGVVAGALPMFLSGSRMYINWYGEPSPLPPLEDIYKSREYAEHDFETLVQLIGTIKGTEEFDPYVFPWIRVSLSRGEIAVKIGTLALLLDTPDYIDRALDYIEFMDSYSRAAFIKHLLISPHTEKQMGYAIQAMTDRGSEAREAACEIVTRMHERQQLKEPHYRSLEAHLRLKAAGMRVCIINILSSLPDEDVRKSLRRLLTDKVAERRLAALDIIKNKIDKGEGSAMLGDILPMVDAIPKPTSKERVLIENINAALANTVSDYNEGNGFGLYNPKDDLHLKVRKHENFDIVEATTFSDGKRAEKLIEGIIAIIEKHGEDTFVNTWGEELKLCLNAKRDRYGHGVQALAFPELWENYYKEEIGSHLDMLKLYLWLRHRAQEDKPFFKTSLALLGKRYLSTDKARAKLFKHKYINQVKDICTCLFESFGGSEETISLSADVISMLATDVKPSELTFKYTDSPSYWEREKEHTIYEEWPFSIFMSLLRNHWDEIGEELFLKSFRPRYGLYREIGYKKDFNPINSMEYIRLWREGYITDNEFWHELLGREASPLMMSIMTDNLPEAPKRYAGQRSYVDFTPEECTLVRTAVDRILEIELRRGDTPTPVSELATNIRVVRGIDHFIGILRALGKDKPSGTFYNIGTSKRGVLSWLLHVCYPTENDTPQLLRQKCEEADIKAGQLVEAAMFSPQWLEIVEEAINWPGLTSGAYYFLAHTGENLSESVKSRLTRYTSVNADDFADGAFDPVWFHEVYDILGPERFETVYDAAKYISSGNRHTRSRKLSDAVLDKLNPEEIEKSIVEKRNKDSVVAYGLIPLSAHPMKDLRRRYKVITTFLKESKQFGAQRQASESRAVALALDNLARTAGFGDSTRLTWSMEADLVKEVEEFLHPKEVDGTTLYIALEDGVPEIVVESKGKRLQNIPARLKKDKYAVKLKEVYAQLKQQHTRGRALLETAMNEESLFTGEEIARLKENPIIWTLLSRLVLMKTTGEFGFPGADGASLTTADGEIIGIDATDKVCIAHPYAMYKAGVWSAFQSAIFEHQLKQPFKQVFRELYLATADEHNHWKSLRYAGNQIMPSRAVALLKKRGWVVDYENGLEKVDYHGNATAVIYAMADWFSPADIEPPTVEYVAFYNRRDLKEKLISDVNPLTFSEIMRDVDLVVSVAHAGGVDPETSHSTIEMRRAIVEHSLPMFRLSNVEVAGNFAKIKGSLATYHIHLGSGVIHKDGGAQIAVLPVHSQSRGRIFLPFLDEDPKTAEILSKIIMFAEDSKIKDPSILSQL